MLFFIPPLPYASMTVEGRNEPGAPFISTMIEEVLKILEMPAVEEIELPALLHALSDPVRLQIVRELAAHGEQACGLMPLPVAPATRSHHFRTLREAGVTVTRVVGTQRLVSLRSDDVDRRFPGLLDAVIPTR
jgi:DNA-binding transcriptional ArsR family regulator